MEFIKNLFPISLNACDLKGLLICIIIYAIVNFVGGLVIGFFIKIPLIGLVFSLLDELLNVYCVIGIVVAFLYCLHIVK